MFGKGYHRQKVIENILVYIDAYILVGRGGGGGGQSDSCTFSYTHIQSLETYT